MGQHDLLAELEAVPNCVSYLTAMTTASHCQHAERLRALCAGMKQKCDLKFRWNQQLDVFRRVYDVEAVLLECVEMKRLRGPPDRSTMLIVLNVCIKLHHFD